MDRVLRGLVRSGAAVGAVGLVLDAAGTRYSGAVGSAPADPGSGRSGVRRAMGVHTVCELPGLLRPLLAVAALQLVESGFARLDENIERVLPELRERRLLAGFDRAGRPVWRRARRRITLRGLLSHTSGLYPGRGTELMAEPGRRWFHGSGLGWATVAVERLGGICLERYLREYVFEPLGMDRTGVGVTGAPHSTPGDVGVFLAALLGRDRRLLSPRGYQPLRTNQIGALRVPATSDLDDVRTPADILGFPEMTLHPDSARRWSLGFLLSAAAVPGGPGAGTLSCAAGPGSYLWWDPKEGVAGLLFGPPPGPAPTSIVDPEPLHRFQLACYAARAAAATSLVTRVVASFGCVARGRYFCPPPV